jgi:hypothetical protein
MQNVALMPLTRGKNKMTYDKFKTIQQLVADMFFDYDRMSSSGQETLETIAELMGVEVED